MNDILAGFGVGAGELASQLPEQPSYPKPVQGRVAHIDSDFIAYQVSAETRDELDGLRPRKSLEEMQHNARKAAEHLMRCAGATDYRCHITPSASTKGGRPGQAVQQEYQANRRDVIRPEFLDAIRHYIAQELNGVVHLDQEADDGMAQANYEAGGPDGAWGKANLTVIVSKDKDLRMVPGLHYDFDSESVFCVGDAFGSVYLDDTKSTKTLKGWGTKFFWAQCLMGDTADNIKGLPEAPGVMHTEFAPTATYKKTYQQWVSADDPEKAAKLEAKLDAIRDKTKRIGPALTYDFLKDVNSDRDAFHVVKRAWQQLERDHGYEFTHWQTGKRVTPTQALLGDMLLLWMRRNKNPNDVLDWIKEVAA